MGRALTVKVKKKNDVVEVKLLGSIDEHAAKPLLDLQARPEPQFDFDFAGVEFVNSSGIREWMRFLRFASQESRRITVAGAHPNFVVAMLNLPALQDGVEVRSIFRAFVCPQKHRTEVLTLAAKLKEKARVNTLVCSSCGETATADDDDEDYTALTK